MSWNMRSGLGFGARYYQSKMTGAANGDEKIF